MIEGQDVHQHPQGPNDTELGEVEPVAGRDGIRDEDVAPLDAHEEAEIDGKYLGRDHDVEEDIVQADARAIPSQQQLPDLGQERHEGEDEKYAGECEKRPVRRLMFTLDWADGGNSHSEPIWDRHLELSSTLCVAGKEKKR